MNKIMFLFMSLIGLMSFINIAVLFGLLRQVLSDRKKADRMNKINEEEYLEEDM